MLKSMDIDINDLPNDVEGLKALVVQLLGVVQSMQAKIETLTEEVTYWKDKHDRVLEQFKLSQQRQFGRSSDVYPGQGLLFETGADVEDAITKAEATPMAVSSYERRHPVRKPLPSHYPREQIIYDLSDEEKQCTCCGDAKKKIGEAISEQLAVVPRQHKVIQHVRYKYACPQCQEGVSIPPMPKLLLPKSMASASLVAHIVTTKYEDHVPLYRQEGMWRRDGVEMPRRTMCEWVLKAAEQCEAVLERMRHWLVSHDVCQVDETRLQVLKEPERRADQKSYLWVYRGGPPGKEVVLFDYQETREGAHAKAYLQGFKGYLQADGYGGYDWVDETEEITRLGCMAHARRPFAELVKTVKGTGKAHQALSLIQKLYCVEREMTDQGLSAKQRYAYRQAKAKPLLDTLHAWLVCSYPKTPPQGALGKAMKYMIDRWETLTNYCLDGRLCIDNNRIENAIRPVALGRKNFLFSNTPRGAKASATLYSLLATAKVHGWNVFDYLKTLFEELPKYGQADDLDLLLPWNLKTQVSQPCI